MTCMDDISKAMLVGSGVSRLVDCKAVRKCRYSSVRGFLNLQRRQVRTKPPAFATGVNFLNQEKKITCSALPFEHTGYPSRPEVYEVCAPRTSFCFSQIELDTHLIHVMNAPISGGHELLEHL